LSSGTREAVFLSLRLALVAGYARRGASLPLILDDVLVNFDTARVQSAARVLCEFAKQGHQLMMFTCHEHILRIFQEAGAEARLLPNREGGQREDIPVLPLAAAASAPAPIPVMDVEPPVIEEPLVPAPRPAAIDDERGKRRRIESKRERRLERRRAAAVETPVAPTVEPLDEELPEPISAAPPTPVFEPPVPPRPIEPPLRLEPDEYRLADEEPAERSRRMNSLPFLHAKEPIDDEGSRDEFVEKSPVPRSRDKVFSENSRATPISPPPPATPSGNVPTANLTVDTEGLNEPPKARSNRRPPPERRFTWESPEMYWRDRDREALV
jgi:hypothetical protein